MSLATKPFVIRIYNDTLNWTALQSSLGSFPSYTLTFPRDGSTIIDGQAFEIDPSGNMWFTSLPYNPRNFLCFFDDFEYAFYNTTATQLSGNSNGSLGMGRWTAQTSGNNSLAQFVRDISATGCVRLVGGDGAGRYGILAKGLFTRLGTGKTEFKTHVRINAVGTVAAQTARLGLFDSTTATAGTVGGLYFQTTTGGGLDLITRDGTTETVTSTGLTIDTSTWYTLRWELNEAGTSVTAEVFIGGAHLPSFTVTATDNIPSRDRTLRLYVGSGQDASIDVDYVFFRQDLNLAPR